VAYHSITQPQVFGNQGLAASSLWAAVVRFPPLLRLEGPCGGPAGGLPGLRRTCGPPCSRLAGPCGEMVWKGKRDRRLGWGALGETGQTPAPDLTHPHHTSLRPFTPEKTHVLPFPAPGQGARLSIRSADPEPCLARSKPSFQPAKRSGLPSFPADPGTANRATRTLPDVPAGRGAWCSPLPQGPPQRVLRSSRRKGPPGAEDGRCRRAYGAVRTASRRVTSSGARLVSQYRSCLPSRTRMNRGGASPIRSKKSSGAIRFVGKAGL
jgi:hypothetical protein